MKNKGATIDRIVGAAVDQLRLAGAANLTVASVAKAAGTSSALVHYHFESKIGLLRVATAKLAAIRLERRTAPLRAAGLNAIDELRLVLEHDAEHGTARAWRDLLLLGTDDDAIRQSADRARADELAMLAQRLPALLSSVGAGAMVEPEQLAAMVMACLDGLTHALATGMPKETFRSAYDAFWLVLIGAGQRARR